MWDFPLKTLIFGAPRENVPFNVLVIKIPFSVLPYGHYTSLKLGKAVR